MQIIKLSVLQFSSSSKSEGEKVERNPFKCFLLNTNKNKKYPPIVNWSLTEDTAPSWEALRQVTSWGTNRSKSSRSLNNKAPPFPALPLYFLQDNPTSPGRFTDFKHIFLIQVFQFCLLYIPYLEFLISSSS